MNASPVRVQNFTESDQAWQNHVEHEINLLQIHQKELTDGLQEQVRAGMVAGMREIIKDDELMQQLSAKLSTNLFVHGGQQASQWLGNRILTAAVIALTGFGVAWLVKNGKI